MDGTNFQPPAWVRSFFEQPVWGMYLLSCLVYALTLMLQETFVLTDEVYYHTMSEQLSMERIGELLAAQRRWSWVGYALIPLSVLLQAALISSCLNIGAILLQHAINFRALFGLVLRAAVIFALARLAAAVSMLFKSIERVEDIVGADRFALLGWLDKDTVPRWLWYPLSVVNVFELLFWLMLAAGLAWRMERGVRASLGFVALTYGTGLALWVLFVVFLQIHLQ